MSGENVQRNITSAETVQWTNSTGSAVVVGAPVEVPGIGLGIAMDNIANGATGTVAIAGINRVTKASGQITVGDPVFVVLGAGVATAATNVKASGNAYLGIAVATALSAATTVAVLIRPNSDAPSEFSAGLSSATSSATAIVLTAASFATGRHAVIASAAGAQAIALPALAEGIPQGAMLLTKKTGSAGAVTITAGTGTTIAGGATHATQDAQNDSALFVFIGTDWVQFPILIT